MSNAHREILELAFTEWRKEPVNFANELFDAYIKSPPEPNISSYEGLLNFKGFKSPEAASKYNVFEQTLKDLMRDFKSKKLAFVGLAIGAFFLLKNWNGSKNSPTA